MFTFLIIVVPAVEVSVPDVDVNHECTLLSYRHDQRPGDYMYSCGQKASRIRLTAEFSQPKDLHIKGIELYGWTPEV